MSCIPIVDSTLNEVFSGVLSSTFPTTAKDFLNSDSQKVLDLLKSYYHSLPPADEDDQTSQLDGLHYRLHQSERALFTLSESTFSSTPYGSPELRSPTSPSVDEDNDKPFPVKKNRKKSRGTSVAIDDSPFRDIGARMPRGLEEAKSLEADLLEERKGILNVSITNGRVLFHYLSILSAIYELSCLAGCP